MSTSIDHLAIEDWLHTFPALANINDAAWLSAQQAARVYIFPANTVVMRPGTPSQGVFLLAKGSVRVFERAANGREIVLYRGQPGEICILSLAKLFNQATYSAEVLAETEVHYVNIPSCDFRNAVANSAAFREAIFSTLTHRLSDLMHLVGQVTFQDLDIRLACLLGQLFGVGTNRVLSITHQELADELGTSREVISRLLKEFEHMGCIRLHRGTIEVLSQHDLACLSK